MGQKNRSSRTRANLIAESPLVAPRVPFPIVAIGASAGGLAAFTALLEGLPAQSGMAFVLIQHLEPKHKSALAPLLSKATSMTVVEVTDRAAVEPDHVYVIPPKKAMTIRQGTLSLTPRSKVHGVPHPIDDFCVALAEQERNGAIGVVLSGTGSDGTCGLKAIKAAGGMTFAQDPKTAEWPAMPTSAITAGSVDFILTPKRIAAELARIGRHPYLSTANEIPEGSDLDEICLALRSATGIDFRLYKQATVRRRIARRMALEKISSLGKYAQILKQNGAEAQALADDIFIHVTSFFRDPECFQALRKRVLAKFRRVGRAKSDPVRIWVAGCSTGEEVYSLAMLLLEELGEQASRTKIQIFGTDIQESAVAKARTGLYSAASLAGVSPARLKRFFTEADHGYQIQKFVRDLCVFSRHDLTTDPPFSKVDLISCRNVLIYMGSALQTRLLSIFQYALKPGGFLFLGKSESIGDSSDAFTMDDRTHHIFVRKPAVGGLEAFGTMVEHLHRLPVTPHKSGATNATGDLRREAERLLLEQYSPAALIVDSDLHIIHFQGDTSPYLAPPTGQPSFHLLKMIRAELAVDLRAAISRVGKERVSKDSVSFQQEGRTTTVRMEVQRLNTPAGKKPNLLVVFQKAQGPDSETPLKKGTVGGIRRVIAVERELASTRKHLHALISEHETAQEEMKAAHEEVLSSNEELQSTNEELETAKEELQSSNEELTTLNDELQHRNRELNILMDDLSNLLVGIDLPVLVLDADLRIRRFTPVAGGLFNLIPGDVGRPFADIASTFTRVDWRALFAEVKRNDSAIEREVADQGGRRYSLHLSPYKTRGKDIQGVLVVLFDTDARSRALEQAQMARGLAIDAQHLSDSILNSLPANVAVLSAEGTIVATNDSWLRFALENGDPPLNAIGPSASYLEVCRRAAACGDRDAQIAAEGIEDVLKGQRTFFQFEYPCHSATEQRWFLMSATPLKGAPGAVITHTNISDRKLAETALQKSEFTIRSLLASAPQSVIAVGPDEKIVFVNGNVERMFGYESEELIGLPLELLVPENSRLRHNEYHRAYFDNMQSRPMGIGMDLEARRKDGTTFPVEIGLSAIETAEGKLAIAFVSDITERRRLEQSAQTHAKEVQALAASLLAAQEEERRRVSRELHDQICQQLASLAIDMGGLVADASFPEEAQSLLKALQARIVKASDETRHIAYELHSSVLDDLGLVASLQDLAKDFSRRTKIGVKMTHDPLPPSLPREIGSCLYRVAQESLQNVIKHAHAKHAKIALTFRKGTIGLLITDDGVGFHVGTVKGRGGLGLIGMEERVRLVKGKLTITAQPGRGTQIALEIPCPTV